MRNFNKTEEAKFILLYACKYGENELVEILIKKGVNVNADNDAALIEASSNSYVEVVEVLLKHGQTYMLEMTKHYGKRLKIDMLK